MAEYVITGGNRLYGEYTVQCAKNSCLTLICAALEVRGETLIRKCPKISDVTTLVKMIRRIGAVAEWTDEGLYIDARNVYSTRIPDKLSCELRASLFAVGPLLSRFKTVSFAQSGGCDIGDRPIDIHLQGFSALGATVGYDGKYLNFFAPLLKGANVHLRYPSVGATENLIMCAVYADGETVLTNCAAEPEVKDLCDFLNLCGAKISGGGTRTVRIIGVKDLKGGVDYTPVPDRIECGSMLLTVMATGGDVTLYDAPTESLCELLQKIENNTCILTKYNGKINIRQSAPASGFGKVVTAPYPGFATDLHPQLAACAACADGKTEITETVFGSRFGYVKELTRFGADAFVEGDRLKIVGKKLNAAKVAATDLRGGMAMVIAALAAEGTSVVSDVERIERGYHLLDEKLAILGADIKRV